MLTGFAVENFKCFESLRLTQLSPITLVGGANNTGKTALLECLYLLLGSPTNPGCVLQLYNMRGLEKVAIEAEKTWGALFRDFQMDHPIRLCGTSEDGVADSLTIKLRKGYRAPVPPPLTKEERPTIRTDLQPPSDALEFDYGEREKIYLQLDPQGSFRAHIENPTQKRAMSVKLISSRGLPSALEQALMFGSLDQQGRTDNILATLKLIEPDLDSMSINPIGPDPVVHVKLKRVAWKIPLNLAGEGMSKLMSIALFLNTAQGGMLLIDEIENGIHYSRQVEIWRAIRQMCNQLNVQLIATTHSYECLRHAVEAFHDAPESSFSYLRLQREEKGITAERYGLEMMETAIAANMEVR